MRRQWLCMTNLSVHPTLVRQPHVQSLCILWISWRDMARDHVNWREWDNYSRGAANTRGFRPGTPLLLLITLMKRRIELEAEEGFSLIRKTYTPATTVAPTYLSPPNSLLVPGIGGLFEDLTRMEQYTPFPALWSSYTSGECVSFIALT